MFPAETLEAVQVRVGAGNQAGQDGLKRLSSAGLESSHLSEPSSPFADKERMPVALHVALYTAQPTHTLGRLS